MELNTQRNKKIFLTKKISNTTLCNGTLPILTNKICTEHAPKNSKLHIEALKCLMEVTKNYFNIFY